MAACEAADRPRRLFHSDFRFAKGGAMSGRVQGLVAVVTGGASGIGLATAELLQREGASVEVLDVANDWDVSDEAQVRDAFASVLADHGRIDMLHNNAGIPNRARVDALSAADWDHVMAVNVRSVFLCARETIVHMAAAG